MSKIEIRKSLSSIKHAERRLEKVQARVRKLRDEAVEEIDRRFKSTIENIQSEIERAKERLVAASEWKVGDQIRRVGGDGMPVGGVYQITSMVDHERFYARRATKKGVLGKEAEFFNVGRKVGAGGHYQGRRWVSGPDVVVKVPKGKESKDKKAR